jgi:mannose-6-phosphate isomerase-like protein (cupin superfamily)
MWLLVRASRCDPAHWSSGDDSARKQSSHRRFRLARRGRVPARTPDGIRTVDEQRDLGGQVGVFHARLGEELANESLPSVQMRQRGSARAGVGISMFIVRTPPEGAVELHIHPYPETFLLLGGHGRWTAGDQIVDLPPNPMLVVPPDTAHGFRNTGDQPLLVISVHEAGTIQQSWLGRDPA